MVNPNLWGPHGWKFMHYVALGYPDKPTLQDKNNYKFFYNNLTNILPCKKCKIHYSKNIKDNPIDNNLDNKNDLFEWTVDIHNMVNRENNKTVYTYEQAYNIYNKQYIEKYDEIYKLIILILILLLVYFIYSKYK